MPMHTINYMIPGATQINMESDAFKLEGDYFVFTNRGPKTVFVIDKKHVSSILVAEPEKSNQA